MTTTQNTLAADAQAVLDDIGYIGFVRALFNRSGDPSKDFTHAVLGIVTEVHEYMQATDAVNAVEEAGDLYFYALALQQVVGDFLGKEGCESIVCHETLESDAFALDAFNFCTSSQAAEEVLRRCTELLDEAKRWVGYGSLPKQPLGVIYAKALNLVSYVVAHGPAQANSPDEIISVNVQKLLKRYQGIVFSADKAMNRDVVAEREVLEGAVSAAA